MNTGRIHEKLARAQSKAVHHQGGQTINAARLEDLKEAKVDATTYDAFVGKYDYGAGKAILTVSREGDHLFAQLIHYWSTRQFSGNPPAGRKRSHSLTRRPFRSIVGHCFGERGVTTGGAVSTRRNLCFDHQAESSLER